MYYPHYRIIFVSGESLVYANGQMFSTFDRDNDSWAQNCAAKFRGGWWYTACHRSNLNGEYHSGGRHESYADGLNWYSWKKYHESMKTTVMMFREIP